jgi:predicted enzyme related to lactoylglutathione lyase
MPEVKRHPQGEPCWAELATSDEKGALKFYSGLFGWKDDAQPMGPGMTYHMQKIEGLTAAALYQMGPEEKGHPPHWRVYFAVTSADETAKKVKAAGGKLMMEPMDVMDAGRMMAAQDPSGAMVAFWQAKRHIGYNVMNEPGAVVWNELLTRDAKKAVPFYKAVLGVEAVTMPMPGMDYTMLKVAGKDVAGIMAMPKEVPAQVPSHWGLYIEVVNADAAVKKAQSLGGKAIMPAQDIPNMGRFATLSDPQGAVFSIFQPVTRT